MMAAADYDARVPLKLVVLFSLQIHRFSQGLAKLDDMRDFSDNDWTKEGLSGVQRVGARTLYIMR